MPRMDRVTQAVRILTLEYCTTQHSASFLRRLKDGEIPDGEAAIVASCLIQYFTGHRSMDLLTESLGTLGIPTDTVSAVVQGLHSAFHELSSPSEPLH